MTLPTKAGFYWAKWNVAAEGTRDGGELTPSDQWMVVEVFEHTIDENDDQHFSVYICGVEKGQSIEDFLWGDGPLMVPEPTHDDDKHDDDKLEHRDTA